MARIRRGVPSAELLAAPENPEMSIAGRYSIRHATARSDLYLFPDSTYIFTRSEDGHPVEIIYDKGKWRFDAGQVVLSSDDSLSRKYAVLSWKQLPLTAQFKGARELFLLDHETFKRFRESIGEHGIPPNKQSDMLLHLYFRRRTEALAAPNAETTKKRLMGKAWHPEFFRGAR
ncbi:MAG: hypothetical protein EOP84_32390 [Verrucomicrobiaceae bacterium]|nr:MAG: hypothetical protein EOP84_32390 [Verrucomicrobiaceae bacterium]